MAFKLMEIRWPGTAPTVEEIKAEFGLRDAELDLSYGVVEVDPRNGTYAILVDENAAEKVDPSGGSGSLGHGRREIGMHGPYSNARIEPTGPPRSGRHPVGE